MTSKSYLWGMFDVLLLLFEHMMLRGKSLDIKQCL